MFNKTITPPIFFSMIVCYFVKNCDIDFMNYLCQGNEIFQILDRGRNTTSLFVYPKWLEFLHIQIMDVRLGQSSNEVHGFIKLILGINVVN